MVAYENQYKAESEIYLCPFIFYYLPENYRSTYTIIAQINPYNSSIIAQFSLAVSYQNFIITYYALNAGLINRLNYRDYYLALR